MMAPSRHGIAIASINLPLNLELRKVKSGMLCLSPSLKDFELLDPSERILFYDNKLQSKTQYKAIASNFIGHGFSPCYLFISTYCARPCLP